MNYFVAILILLGALVLIVSTFRTGRIIQATKGSKYAKQWKLLRVFMYLFAVGYLMAIADLLINQFMIIDFLIGVVFLLGAVFVYIVVNTGYATISELKETMLDKSEKTTLLKEIHHRVKNNLQVISSLLNLQSDKVNDQHSKDVLQECHRRTRTMALVHENLYGSHNFSGVNLKKYFDDLLSDIIASYQLESKVEYETKLINVETIGLDTIVPLGLLVSELVSNCMKHAFAGIHDGFINVKIEKIEGSYLLVLSDNGVGINKSFLNGQRDTLGLDLVQALTEQLDGFMEVKSDNGTTFSISFQCKDDNV